MLHLNRIKDLNQRLEEYENVLKLKLQYDFEILSQLARLDEFLMPNEDTVTLEDITVPTEETEETEDDEILEPALPVQVKSKRGRPKKKRN